MTPSARRLTDSLRDIGYDFVVAIADLVDNSVSAGASKVDVVTEFDGPYSKVVVADDGFGMTPSGLIEAMRFGSQRDYERGDLGRFGLGLKTASISQCRKLTVVTRHAPIHRRLHGKCLDLDHVSSRDRWEITDADAALVERAREWLDSSSGTVAVWDNLDRVLPEKRQDGGWAKRRLEQLANRSAEHLGMVFHRFLEGEFGEPLVITVNGEKVHSWNPFAPDEAERMDLPEQNYEVVSELRTGTVRVKPSVLPSRNSFSSQNEFERLSGPRKWNRQQGFYFYRSGRMIQSGGWCGLRAADEHTKLARVLVDFESDLDGLFRLNVAKMRVSLPPELRNLIERPVNEVCHLADSAYRKSSKFSAGVDHHPESTSSKLNGSRVISELQDVGATLIVAAMELDEYPSLDRIMSLVRKRSPHVASGLGWQQ